MKTVRVILIIAIIISVFGVIKYYLLTPKTETRPTGPATGGAPATPVNIYLVKSQELNNKVFSTGTVIANEEVMLMPEISGKIIYLNINEGSNVKQGDLLLKINDADFQVQLKKQELQLKLAEEKLARQKQLLSIYGISQEEYDISLNLFNSIKADMDFSRVQIAKTEVRAPFNGTIGLKYVSLGSTVNTSTRIASIQQMNQVKIDFSVPEKYAGVLAKNDSITFRISDNNKVFKAKIFAIEPKIDQATRSLQLRAIAENSKGELYAGSFAKIELQLQQVDNALMIPTEAIIPILKGKKVFLCKNGKAQEAIVETGIRTDTQIQIISGVAEGDTIVTTGIMQIKQGTALKILDDNN